MYFIVLFLLIPFFAFALNISEEFAVQTALKNSLESKKIQSEQKSYNLVLSEAESFLDWQIFTQFDSKTKQQNTLNFFENPLQKNQNFSLGIDKYFLTGTNVLLLYSHIYSDRQFNTEFTKISDSPTTVFTQQIGLKIEQDISLFGYADRRRWNIARLKAEQQKLKLMEEKENLILKTVQQFWATYTQWLGLQLQITKQKDYRNLLRVTKEKNKYGYIKPGELYQIQAEWEKVKQDNFLQQTEYQDELAKLLDLMNIPPSNKKVKFIIARTPPPPSNKWNIPKNPRKTALLKKNFLIQKERLQLQKTSTYPVVKLFGSYNIGGYETDFFSAWKGLKDRNTQDYSVGVKLSYPFSTSSVRKKRVELSKQALSATKWEWKIGEQEFERLTDELKRNLTSLYSAVKSSEKIRRLRAKSYKEIRKAFLQGRLDVFQLIQAKNFALQSEIKKAVFMSLYYESLTYALALQDELIPSYIKKTSTKKKKSK